MFEDCSKNLVRVVGWAQMRENLAKGGKLRNEEDLAKTGSVKKGGWKEGRRESEREEERTQGTL